MRYVREKKEKLYRFGWGNLKDRDNSKHAGVDRNLILRQILQKRCVGWADLAQVRNKWRDLANTFTNLNVP